MSRRLAVSLVLFLALIPCSALAGTLCGTITDRSSSAPVANAGIFLRLPSGSYTGINGASDGAGHFCINNIDPGTYDLEVRVDDEQVAYLRGVVVTGTSVDVPIGVSEPVLMLADPTPNPARSAAQLEWTLSEPSRVRLFVFDVRGRIVRGWTSGTLPAGHHSFTWNLRDAGNRPSDPGTYFVRLDAAGASLVRTLVITR
jgi:hypothetical protein